MTGGRGNDNMDIINKEKILEHAKKLISEGKFDRAIAEYEKLLSVDPDDLRIRIKIAELCVKRKQISEAIRIYKEVAQKYAGGSFYLKAATVYKNILRLNPSLIDVNTSLAELYEKMGLIQDALYQYHIVATSLEQKNDANAMLGVREKMSNLDPENTSLKIRLAETYQLRGEADKSIDIYESLATSLKNKKDSKNTDQLVELYNKILSHRPEKHELLRELCHILYRRGEWKDILKHMEGSKDFVAGDPELLAMQAEIYGRLNQIETAKSRYHDLAALLNAQGDPDGALKAFENILYLGPEDEESISGEIESIREGALDDLRKKVDLRRKKAADEESKREDLETKLKEAPLPDLGAPATAGNVTSIQNEANICYDLGMMYKMTGLENESRAELTKALNAYRRIVADGAGNEQAAKRLAELEGLAGPPPAETKQAKQAKPAKQVKQAEPAQSAKPSNKKVSFV